MDAKPLWLLAELTYKCPLQCPYCSNPLDFAGPRFKQELSTDEWCRVFREAKALGVLQLGLSGGEPTLRSDLEELVREAHGLGLYTSLITSAYRLTKERLAALKAAGLDHVQISIQGADAELSDAVAGTASYRDKIAAYHYTRELGFPLAVNVVLHRRSLHQVEALIRVARVQHHVDRERKPELARVVVRGDLVSVRRGTGDGIGQLRVRSLNADLHVVEPGGLERREALLGEPVRRRDQRGVEPQPVGLADQLLQIRAESRFASGGPQLQHAERFGLAEHATPLVRGQLLLEARAGEIQRIGAVRALQRTLVGELRQEPERLRVHTSPAPLPRARPGTR